MTIVYVIITFLFQNIYYDSHHRCGRLIVFTPPICPSTLFFATYSANSRTITLFIGMKLLHNCLSPTCLTFILYFREEINVNVMALLQYRTLYIIIRHIVSECQFSNSLGFSWLFACLCVCVCVCVCVCFFFIEWKVYAVPHHHVVIVDTILS